MSDTMVSARVDADLKDETDKIFSELGITTTEAIRMFLAQVKLRRGLPFPVSLPSDNEDLLTTPEVMQSAFESIYDDGS